MKRPIIVTTLLIALAAVSPLTQASHYHSHDDAIAAGVLGFVLGSVVTDTYGYRPRREVIIHHGYTRPYRGDYGHRRHPRRLHYGGHRGGHYKDHGHRGKGYRR